MKHLHAKITTLLAAVFALVISIPGSVRAGTNLDPTFGTGGRVIHSSAPVFGGVRRVRIQLNGKIVTFGGRFVNSGPSFITRHNPDGSLDTSFGTNGQVNTPTDFNQYFNDLVVLADGNLVATGSMPNVFGEVATGLITYDALGRRVARPSDASWDNTPGRRLLVQNDGKLVVIAGMGYPTYGAVNLVAIRYSGDGQFFDKSFGDRSLADPNVSIYGFFAYWSHYGADFFSDALIQPDGKILMAGYGYGGGKLVRLNSDGSLDAGFGNLGVTNFSDLYDHPAGIAIQPDGKIVMNGVSAEFGLYSSFILRLNPNGSVDTFFGTNGSVSIHEPDPESRGIGAALAIQSNGKIITAGERTGGFALMRFDTDGTLDTDFGVNGTLTTQMGDSSRAAILSLAWQPDGKLVAAGSVGDPAVHTDIGIARYSVDDSGIKVSGRVVSPNGSPLRNVTVILTDSQGTQRTSTTSSFGVFEFHNVTQDETYTISVSSKRYRFPPKTIQPTTDLILGDIVGLE